MPFPNFDPVLVHLGPFAVRWYALAYVAGILLGWRYTAGLTRDLRLWRGRVVTATAAQIDDFVVWVTLGIILGGRLGYVLFYMVLQQPAQLLADPLMIVRTWEGGMSFHGGLIGVTLAILLFARRHRLDVVRLADLTAPCIPIGLGFGRLANFINGELWGRTTTAPWGIVFPHAGALPRHPSQLYEAALEGVVLFLLLRLGTHARKLLPRRGALAGLFLIGYGISRILLENVREPDVGMPQFPLGLTMGMLLSAPLVLGGIALMFGSRSPGALAPLAPAADEAPTPDFIDDEASPPEIAADPFLAADDGAAASFAPDREPSGRRA